MTFNDILAAFGVPKPILAQTDGVNYANAKSAKDIFLSETIKPLLTNLVDKLNEYLVPDDLTLTFVDPTPKDEEIKLKSIESGIKNYYMTINEARQMQGFDPLPDGDVVMTPFNLVPLGEGKASEEGGSEEGESENEKSGGEKKKTLHPLRNKAVRRLYHKQYIKKTDRQEKLFIKKFKKYIAEQAERVVGNMEKKKSFIDENFNLALEVNAGKEILMPVLEQIMKDGGQQAFDLMNFGAVYEPSVDIKSTLDKRADFFIEKINETNFEKLKASMSEGLEQGEGTRELVNRIRDVYDEDISVKRAEVIARTEVGVANQVGLLNGYKNAGMGIKIWVAVLDDKTRDTHAMIDGEEVPIDMPFSNGLMMPNDPAGSASEVINCRCSI